MLKVLFVLEILTSWSKLFGFVEKWLDKKAMDNFRIYNATDWAVSNYNTHINQYLKK